MEAIASIIGVREDVHNILIEVNFHLKHAIGVQFAIGVGLDGPTACGSS